MGPTIFFSDRPKRVTGQVRTTEFIAHWDKGSDNFAENPPNGTRSIFGKNEIDSVVVELTGPNLKRDILSYKVKVLRGKLPASFKESSLFIDILGRWRMYARGMAVGAAIGGPSHYYYHPPVVMAAAAPFYGASLYIAPRPVEQTRSPSVNVTVTSPPGVTGGQTSVVARLKELKSLLSQGLITQSQYQEESQKILNQLAE